MPQSNRESFDDWLKKIGVKPRIVQVNDENNLTELDLSSCQLTHLSPEIGQLNHLQSLDISSNQISQLPPEIGQLTNLQTLNLSSNQLSQIPSEIAQLTNLQSLYLDNNQLSQLLPQFGQLTNLQILDLSFNQLSQLPLEIGQLTNLQTLDLSFNQLSQLLPQFGQLTNLQYLNLDNNPLKDPPPEIVKAGIRATLEYLRHQQEAGTDTLYEAKLIIVGEGGAGKTTLAHKIENPDCPLPNIDDRTRGITINPHHFITKAKNSSENRSFQLNVWDFGGQEIYHATHRFFLSKRSLYVLVADNRKDEINFNYWLNIIELFAGESPIIIVLNEKDDIQRKVNVSELRSRYPESIKEVVAVNFKTAEEIDENKRQQRLKKICELISHIEHYAANLPHIGESIPALWVDVKAAVENDTRNYIYREQFEEICYNININKTEDINTLLGYFHDLGIVLNFAENPLLNNWVILKPAWATNAIYKIFDDDTIKAKQGRFQRSDCVALWSNKQYNYMQSVLIELMKIFRLVYEIENTGNLVVPQMLPQNTPAYDWDDNNNSLMQFRYDFFMPKGIFWNLL